MKKFTSATQQLAYLVILVNLSVSVSMLTTAAKTIQDFKKWEKGENLIENGSFEDGIAAWHLEDGACCDRGGQYEWEVEKKMPPMVEKH